MSTRPRRFIPKVSVGPRPFRMERQTNRERHDALARDIANWCRANGIAACVVDREGALDIFGPMPPTGRHWQIEVKTGRAELTPNQQNLERLLTQNGAAVYVAHSLAEAVQFLRLLHAGEKAKAAKLAKEVA